MGNECWGLGAVIHDWEGNVMLATTDVIKQAVDVEIAKALAMRFGFLIARDACFFYLEIEGDKLGAYSHDL